MKKIIFITIPLFFLVGCMNDEGTPSYKLGSHNFVPNPTNPKQDFENSAVVQNDLLTSLNTRNAEQVSEYITYRLNEWDDFNKGVGSDINKLDIAKAALWLTDVNKTEKEIEEEFADKEDLFHMAVYVIDNRLNRCFKDGVLSAKCFVNWRNNYLENFNKISEEIKKNAVLITANDALLQDLNGDQLKFTLNKDGLITGISVIDNQSNDEEIFSVREGYNNFSYIYDMNPDAETYDKKVLTYSSVGKVLGLTYSDFGSYSIKTDVYDIKTQDIIGSNIEKRALFAGGYDAYKISENKIQDSIDTDIDFYGTALGRVTNSENDELLIFDNNAKLSFGKTTGRTNLFVDFVNWYTISVDKDINATEADIEFSNYTGPSDFELPNDITNGTVNMTVGYYGAKPDDGIPTEATGLVQFSDPSGINLGLTFGVK